MIKKLIKKILHFNNFSVDFLEYLDDWLQGNRLRGSPLYLLYKSRPVLQNLKNTEVTRSVIVELTMSLVAWLVTRLASSLRARCVLWSRRSRGTPLRNCRLSVQYAISRWRNWLFLLSTTNEPISWILWTITDSR